jgi:hypothetical protein
MRWLLAGLKMCKEYNSEQEITLSDNPQKENASPSIWA